MILILKISFHENRKKSKESGQNKRSSENGTDEVEIENENLQAVQVGRFKVQRISSPNSLPDSKHGVLNE